VGLFTPHIAIDLGTVNILVFDQGRGVVLQEPSVVAIREDGDKTTIVEVGRAAKDMYGRTPEQIEVMRPLRDGVIADYFVTQGMLEYFISKVTGRFRLRKPVVMISVPYGVTSVERRAVREAALSAGAREVYLIPEPLAAAIGAGLPIGTPKGIWWWIWGAAQRKRPLSP
jgi:rod shape-determining protein MreB